jgi:hypothetical protein
MDDSMESIKNDLNNKTIGPHKKDLKHLGTASFVRLTHMIQDSAGLQNTHLNIKHSNVRSTTHAICASKQVNIKQIHVHAS